MTKQLIQFSRSFFHCPFRNTHCQNCNGNGTPIIMYGNAPYQFQYLEENDKRGIITFTMPVHSSTISIPEMTFSGMYDAESKVLTLSESPENSFSLGKESIDFVKN